MRHGPRYTWVRRSSTVAEGLRGHQQNAGSLSVLEYSKDEILTAVKNRIKNVDIILDVGCGIKPVNYFLPVTHICVEPFEPYVAAMPKDRRFLVFNSTWDKVLPEMAPKSVDTVFLLDVIEHIEKAEGLQLLEQAQRLASCQVIVFTPLGFYPQSYDHEETDRWGFKGGYWQTHRSGWVPADFENGWQVLVCSDFHKIDQHDEELEEGFGALWAVWTADACSPEENAAARSMRRMRPWLRLWLEAVVPSWMFRFLLKVRARTKSVG